MSDSESIRAAIRILRNITITIKITPFAVVFLYSVCLVAYMFTDDTTQTILDMMFYVSPAMVLFMYVLSKVVHMCVWHKLECFLPLVPQIAVIADYYSPLDEIAAKVNVAVIAVIFLLSFVNAYFTFLRK